MGTFQDPETALEYFFSAVDGLADYLFVVDNGELRALLRMNQGTQQIERMTFEEIKVTCRCGRVCA